MVLETELGPQLADYVAELVRSGRYGSEGEVLREGVKLLRQRHVRVEVLDASIARGLADAEAGRLRPVSDVFDELERDLALKGVERSL